MSSSNEASPPGPMGRYGVPVVDLATRTLDPALIALVPRQFAERFLVVPVRLQGGVLTVATANPRNILAFDDLRFATGLSIDVWETTEESVRSAINRLYPHSEPVDAPVLNRTGSRLADPPGARPTSGVMFDLMSDVGDEDADDDRAEGLVPIRSEHRTPVPRAGAMSARTVDPVDCTLFAPLAAGAGESLLVQVFAHRPEQSDDAARLAMEFDATTKRRGVKRLELEIPRGARLRFHLSLRGLEVDDPIQTLVWQGNVSSVQFGVTVPSTFKSALSVGTLSVDVDSVPVGVLKFLLSVEPDPPKTYRQVAPQGMTAVAFRKAFVSYAAADRAEVLKRIQMLGTLRIDFFQDVLDLAPGDRWEQELYRHIDECDLFLLFWSRAARDSRWVLEEVKYALERRNDSGGPEIRPVLLEGPPPVEPPGELADLHFNDRLLYFIR